MISRSARTRRAGRCDGHAVDGLAGLDRAAWDALVRPGRGAISHEYLIAWEKGELAGRRSRPLLAHAPGENNPVACCPGYWHDLDLLGTRYPSAAGALAVARRVWPRLMKARTYELSSPASLTNPFLVAPGADAEDAVGALLDAAAREARQGHAQFMMVQNLTSLDGPAARALVERGFAGVSILPTAVVDLPYGSFDEYLGAMRSQYRRRAARTLKQSAHLSFEHRTEFAELAEELARLWRLVYDRAKEVRHEVLTPDYFRAVSALADASVLLARRPDGSIASFALLLADRPWLTFLSCGFEQDSGRDEGAYFRLLYEIVRLAVDGGYQQVDLGMTTLEPKLDVGGVPIPQFALVRHRNRAVHRIVQKMADGMPDPGSVVPRRVFKQAPPSAAELVARRACG